MSKSSRLQSANQQKPKPTHLNTSKLPNWFSYFLSLTSKIIRKGVAKIICSIKATARKSATILSNKGTDGISPTKYKLSKKAQP